LIVEDVETWQLMHGYSFIKYRIRLAAIDLNVVAEIDKGLCEVAGVDALASYVGLSSVREIGNT
jgi:hypothetical protein